VVTGRWRSFGYDALTQRDKVNLDIFWLRDDSLEDAANLPDPDVIAAEIIEDLDAALAQFELIQGLVKTGGQARGRHPCVHGSKSGRDRQGTLCSLDAAVRMSFWVIPGSSVFRPCE
jgi:hypothetical protein